MMAKYNIDDFYLGILHIGYKRMPFGEYNPDFHIANEKYLDLVIDGAVDLDELYDDWSRDGYSYKRLLTIFYHLSDDKYLCLHDKNLYGKDNLNYYSDLSNLRDYLPKMGFNTPIRINVKEAKDLFSALFGKKKLQYTNTKFPIHHFYLGKIDACDKVIVRENQYPYKKFDSPLNVPENHLLLPNYCECGYTIVKDDERGSSEYFFSTYDSLFYVQNNVLYSINSHQVYRNDGCFDRRAELYYSLEDELQEQKIAYNHEISIPYALHLQKRLKDQRKRF